MLYLILLPFGIIYLFRRFKLSKVTQSDIENVPPDNFQEWFRLELKSIDLFLVSIWGPVIIGVLSRMLNFRLPPYSLLVWFVVFLVIAAVFGSRAATIKKQFGFKWP